MPAVAKSVRAATLLALVCLTVSVAPAAHAGGRGEDGNRDEVEQNADVNGDAVSVSVGGVVFDHSKNGSGNSTGTLTSSTSWSPPPCRYAPKYTPEQLQKYLEPIWEAGSTGYE
ncbi:hypothetical protein RMT89_40065, partial [Streptomyces sp. P17]|nr:hypothetical protein [Streptomyces sp. P17]